MKRIVSNNTPRRVLTKRGSLYKGKKSPIDRQLMMNKMTHEEENMYRLLTLVTKNTRDVYTDLLQFYLDQRGITLHNFLMENQHELFHMFYDRYPCCQCPPDTRPQRRGGRIIFKEIDILLDKTGVKLRCHSPGSQSAPYCCSPVNPSITLETFDLTMLRLLLVNFTNIIPDGSAERNAFEDLYKIRNNVFHKYGGIADNEFKNLSAAIQQSLLVLAKVIGKQTSTLENFNKVCQQPPSFPFRNQFEKQMQWMKALLPVHLEKDKITENTDTVYQLPNLANPQSVKKLLLRGTYKSYENTVSLCGASNVGKSTLASLMIGDEMPLTWKSTDGLNIHFGRNGIDLDKCTMIPLKEGSTGNDVFAKVLLGEPKSDVESSSTDEVEQKSDVESSSRDVVEQKSDVESFTTKMEEEDRPRTKYPKIESKYNHQTHLPIEISIHEDLMKDIKDGKYKMKIAPSDLIDFGGQKSFDMTHQLFIRRDGSFVLMFDGRYGLYEKLKEYAGNLTAASILIHWVNSILTYCGGDDDKMPMILFAATHSDSFTEMELIEKRKEFTREITRLFSNHGQHQHIVYDRVFFINPTNKNDYGVQELMAKLVEIAFKQPTWGRELPMAYVPLELQLSKMRAQNISLISRAQLAEVNQGNGELSLTDDDLEDFLKVQHGLGKILYFHEQSLNEFIVVKPTALVNILKSFITDEMFWPHDEDLLKILRNLTSTGSISKLCIFKLWNQQQFKGLLQDEEVKDFMIKVLVHLDILVEPKRYRDIKESSVDEYLVPCMVKAPDSSDFLEDENVDEKTICLSYRLLKNAVPSALCFKMIGAVLSIWPFKEYKGRPCLYRRSAVLFIDEDNELKLTVEEDRIIAYLKHKTSRIWISPDIAASIQECLTLTLDNALYFYHSCIGKRTTTLQLQRLYEMELGILCQKSVCVLPASRAQTMNQWTCEKNQNRSHETKYALYWIFEKNTDQEECPKNCEGLPDAALNQSPQDKHLVRLASRIGIASFRELVIHLGLPENSWDEIDYRYGRNEVRSMKCMALCEWRKQTEASWSKEGTLKDLQRGFLAIQDDRHHLCQISRERTEILGIADSSRLKVIPEDNVLRELTRHIGNCSLQLGIELGLSFVDVENITCTCIRNKDDMFEETYGVLKKWKQKCQVPTLYVLMKALQRVDARGMKFLRTKYRLH